jgi:hypothetical protein
MLRSTPHLENTGLYYTKNVNRLYILFVKRTRSEFWTYISPVGVEMNMPWNKFLLEKNEDGSKMRMLYSKKVYNLCGCPTNC